MRTCLAMMLLIVGVQAPVALAQAQVNQPDGRGGEGGLEVMSGTGTGEVAFHIGYFQGSQLVAFRFGARDETDSIPCSLGVMYEYAVGRSRARTVTPIVGASLSRIFSCATDADLIERPSPDSQGALLVNGGVRILIFSGNLVSGSLKLQGYVERLNGHEGVGDATSKGVMVGVVIHGR